MNTMKTKAEAMLRSIIAHEKAVKEEGADFIHHLKEWGEKDCPIKIGDTVKANGYAYSGKDMRVEAITAFYEDKWFTEAAKWQWRLSGAVLKKDGTNSANMGTHTIDME